MTGNETMVSYQYGQGNLFTYYMRNKARHRESFPCPKKSKLNRGVELCVLSRSVTTWLIAPSATRYNSNTPGCETGHKIVTSGALLANTLETLLAKVLMVSDAETSTVRTALRMSSGYEADQLTDKGWLECPLDRDILPLSLPPKYKENR